MRHITDNVAAAPTTDTALHSAGQHGSAKMISGSNLNDGSYASAVQLYGMQLPYAITDLASVLASGSATVLDGAQRITVSGATMAAQLLQADSLTSNALDVTGIPLLSGTMAELQAACAAPGIVGLGNEALTLLDSPVNASALLALAQTTTGQVDVSAAITIVGMAQAIIDAFSLPNVAGLGTQVILPDGQDVTAGQLLQLDALSTGEVSATNLYHISGTVAQLDVLYSADGLVDLAHKLLNVDDTSVPATALTMLALQTLSTVDATSVLTISGAATSIIDVYTLSNIIGLATQALLPDDTVITATQLLQLDALSMGPVDATHADYISGSVLQLEALYNSAGIINLANKHLLVNETVLPAADLLTLSAQSHGLIDASSLYTVSGAAATIATAYGTSTISGLGDEQIVLGDTSISATTLTAIDALTTSTVDASAITTVSGSAASIAAAYGVATVVGLGNETIVLSDSTINATTLAALDALTTATVDASSVTTLTGNAASIRAEYDANAFGVTGLGNEQIKLTDTTLAAPMFPSLFAATTGIIDASTVTTVTGLANDVIAAYSLQQQISGLGNETIVLSDTNVAASALQWCNTDTSGIVNASSVTTISGTLSSVQSQYNANASGAISGLGNEAVVLSDTSVLAALLKNLDASTTGVINAASLTSINGQAADIQTVYGSSGISGLGNEALTVSDPSLAASTLTTLDTLSTGVLNASAVGALTGTPAQLLAAYGENTSGTISGLGNESVTVSGNATIPQLQSLNAITSGQVWYTKALATTSSDTFTLDGAGFSGTHSLVYTAGNQAASAWFTNVAGAGLANGDTFTLNSAIDVIGFASGDVLNLAAFGLVGQSGPSQFGATGSKLADAEFDLVRGNLSGSVFTANSAGNALLVVWDGNTTAGAVTDVAVVLTGVSSIAIGSALLLS